MNRKEYGIWCEKAVKDPDIQTELKKMSGNDELISECFYKDLEFGTGGLRGVIGAGTNRMNVYTVGKATQGLADYINSKTNNPSAAVAYDSRIKSELFAHTAAAVLAANGIHVYIYRELMPTPMLSFAVRKLGCDTGIAVTASHNPAKYNGYKVYAVDGCQLCPREAEKLLSIMNGIDVFDGVRSCDFDSAIAEGKIEYISQSVIDSYLDCVYAQRIEPELDMSSLRVVYTPLHGAGNKPVRAILSRAGIKEVAVVPEQEKPDGTFPTVPFPNPEFPQAFELAIKLAEKEKPDILIATDPDSDRVGTAMNINGEYRLFSGNEMGALLLDYILSRRQANGTLPKNAVAVKTIVTTELAEKIARDYGIILRNVLTGFKYIGEQIGLLEAMGEESRFVFGFEESYGYLAGSYVRDKDAVVTSLLICEMTAYYKSIGKTLLDVLNALYEKHGYYVCSQKSYTFENQSGKERIESIMDSLRLSHRTEIAKIKTSRFIDYEDSLSLDMLSGKSEEIDLPKSDVVEFELTDGSSVVVRPSGTEPKIKFYFSAAGEDKKDAEEKNRVLTDAGEAMVGVD